MSNLVDRLEDADKVTFVAMADGQQTSYTVTIYKMDPPEWRIKPSLEQQAGRTWQDIVDAMDVELGVTQPLPAG